MLIQEVAARSRIARATSSLVCLYQSFLYLVLGDALKTHVVGLQSRAAVGGQRAAASQASPELQPWPPGDRVSEHRLGFYDHYHL